MYPTVKYWLFAIIVLALVFAGYWAGTKHRHTESEATATNTPHSSSTVLPSPVVVYSPSITAAVPVASLRTDVMVGNRPGNRAPDFQLKDMSGATVSLRDYLGREEIRLVFSISGQVALQGRTLQDPDDIVHKLYAVSTMPYTVEIDTHGIIK